MPNPAFQNSGEGLQALRARWGWIVGLGVLFSIAGLVALAGVMAATAVAAMVIGVMMVLAGAAEIVAAFRVKEWGKSLLWGLLGALYVLAGAIAFTDPFGVATILTLILGFALVVSGVMRIVLGFQMRGGARWGWVVLSGVVTTLLGIVIVIQWPASGLFVLGLFLGVDLLIAGAVWIAMGLALKKAA